MTAFKDRLTYALELRQMKPVELSEKTGISKARISQYMSGTYSPKSKGTLAIANALNVSETWLMGLDVPMERKGIKFMHNLYKLINSLCMQNNINVSFMCKELSISQSTLSELNPERAKVLSSEILNKIASFFHVTSDFLLEEAESENWNEFGFIFGVDDEVLQDCYYKWKKAIKKYGFCWNAKYRNEVKNGARFALGFANISDDEIINYNELVFKSLFSRSLEGCDYSLEHISFKEYVGAMLNQAQFKTSIPVSVYNKMVEKYGINNLIKKGTYYGGENIFEDEVELISEQNFEKNNKTINNIVDKLLSQLDKISLFNIENIAQKFSELNAEGQEKVVTYASDLVDSGKYKKSDTDDMADEA